MSTILYYISVPFGYLMKWCWMLTGNYGLAIILFTLATKIVLMPLSVWIQKNSIIMVKIQPEVNFLKARMHGNLDAIADGQSEIYKREHYHPLITIIPLILQVVLLLAVVEIIYHPFNYLFGFGKETIEALAAVAGLDTESSTCQLKIIGMMQTGQFATLPGAGDIAGLSGIIEKANSLELGFLGFNLSYIPAETWGIYVIVPILAGASSFVMCLTQNISNVLQHEQGKLNQYGIMALSIALSLYLGLFVPAGTALYWIASNLMSIGVMYLLNWLINPKKYVDYKALEESRKALADAKAFGAVDKKDPRYAENKKREKTDYKKFKGIANKHVVIYSEKSGFYKYYKDVIAELLKRSNLAIHYVTNDSNDIIFEVAKSEPRIKPYYIGLKKLVTLMMFVETDMFIMTTPDLNTYYLKRSFIKKDIEYVYFPHDTMSSFYGFKEGAFDNFDTIFCSGEHIKEEIRKTEEVYGLPKKTLVEFGFPLSDYLEEMGNKANEERRKFPKPYKQVLIAPSWQEDNLLDSCADDLIASLYGDGYKIIVRPHPEYVKRYGARLSALIEKYKDADKDKLVFETDFSANESVYSSDILITDWSGVGPEFCFATKRPAIFVNTKPKCENPNWQKVGIEPVEMLLRKELGEAIGKGEAKNVKAVVEKLLGEEDLYAKKIAEIYDGFIYNHGTAAENGAKYILTSLAARAKQKKDKK